MPKSPDAFRTISEVAEWLGIQAHVLRFWESKFTQIKPIKRAGGRRYYRPADMLLLGGIKRMLHDDGLTIKGVQKVLREEGMNYVAAMSGPLDELAQAELGDAGTSTIDMVPPAPEIGESVVLPFEAARPAAADNETSAPQTDEPTDDSNTADQSAAPTKTDDGRKADSSIEVPSKSQTAEHGASTPTPDTSKGEPVSDIKTAPQDLENEKVISESEPETTLDAASDITPRSPTSQPLETVSTDTASSDTSDGTETEDQVPAETTPKEELPAFLRQPLTPPSSEQSDNTPTDATPPQDAPRPKPRVVDVAIDFSEADMPASAGALSSALRKRKLSPEVARNMLPVLSRLAALRDSMSSDRSPAAKD
jgi:DNA-binding transcriptional MerR regulator